MNQDINLYYLLPHKAKSWITKKTLFVFYSLFVLLLFFKYINELWNKHHLTLEYQQEVILLANAQNQLTYLMKQYPSIDVKNIQNAGAALHAELNNENEIVNLLAQSSKFSAYLLGLAEASVSNAWLTDIFFSSNEPTIVLKGSALQAQDVQQFLDHLIYQPIFLTLPFKINELTSVTFNQGTLVNFTITTKIQNIP